MFQLGQVFFDPAPNTGVDQVMLAEKIDILVRELEMLHHAFVVRTKNAVAVLESDQGIGRSAFLGVKVGDVHAFGDEGLPHAGAVSVRANKASIRCLLSQSEQIHRDVNRVPAWESLSQFDINIRRVITYCRNSCHPISPIVCLIHLRIVSCLSVQLI